MRPSAAEGATYVGLAVGHSKIVGAPPKTSREEFPQAHYGRVIRSGFTN